MERAGFWRRIRVTPSSNLIQVEVEDDFHCMSLIVQHDGDMALQIIPRMYRAPWSTCPGALEQIVQTFTGVALHAFSKQGGKKNNCTHLYDLALLAASHASDAAQTLYDIRVSDPENGRRFADISRNDESVMSWVESGFRIVEPEDAAGLRLDQLRTWIEKLDPALRGPARLLQWGNILANGRIIPLEEQSDAARMPPHCYTFQPERVSLATRIGRIRDFSQEHVQPLAAFEPVIWSGNL